MKRGVAANARQAEQLGDGGDDGHGTVGRDGEHALDAVLAAERGERLEIAEVNDVAVVGERQRSGVGLAIDRDDLQAQLVRAVDGAPLVDARADEEDGRHLGRRCYSRAHRAGGRDRLSRR